MAMSLPLQVTPAPRAEELGGSWRTSPPHPLLLPDPAVEDNPTWESQRVILVVFLGGCTFSEISALRFLGKEKGISQAGCWGLGRRDGLGVGAQGAQRGGPTAKS